MDEDFERKISPLKIILDEYSTEELNNFSEPSANVKLPKHIEIACKIRVDKIRAKLNQWFKRNLNLLICLLILFRCFPHFGIKG